MGTGPLSTFAQLYHFAVFHVGAVDDETDEGADRMPSLAAGGTGVDMQAFYLIVIHDLEDMGVAADEELGRVGNQFRFDGGVLFRGIAADMGHEHFYSFGLPAQGLGVYGADVLSVDVAVYAFQGAEFF